MSSWQLPDLHVNREEGLSRTAKSTFSSVSTAGRQPADFIFKHSIKSCFTLAWNSSTWAGMRLTIASHLCSVTGIRALSSNSMFLMIGSLYASPCMGMRLRLDGSEIAARYSAHMGRNSLRRSSHQRSKARLALNSLFSLSNLSSFGRILPQAGRCMSEVSE